MGHKYNGTDPVNCYTTDANTKVSELNVGIDEVGGNNTEEPWIADSTTNPINGGYPILSWQVPSATTTE